MKNMTVRVRMHPMYADFIKNDFEADTTGLVFASEKKPIGLLIKNLLHRQPENFPKREYDKNAYVEFILPDYNDVNTLYRNHISENSELIIAQKIRNLFFFEIHQFIQEMNGAGVTEIRRSIILFCETFGIQESSYKTNSIEKEYRRYRNRLAIIKKTKKITSALMA